MLILDNYYASEWRFTLITAVLNLLEHETQLYSYITILVCLVVFKLLCLANKSLLHSYPA